MDAVTWVVHACHVRQNQYANRRRPVVGRRARRGEDSIKTCVENDAAHPLS